MNPSYQSAMTAPIHREPVCRECESVLHCMANGCIPATDDPLTSPEQAFGWIGWTLTVVALFLLAAIVALPLYFGTFTAH